MMFSEKQTGNVFVRSTISNRSNCMPNNETFAGKICKVLERQQDTGNCLVLAPGGVAGMADLDASDIALYIPMEKSGGNFIVPANLTIIESMNWMAMCHEYSEVYNPAVIWFAGKYDRPPEYKDFRELYKLCSEPNSEISNLWAYMKMNEADLRKIANDFTS
jgi:hypothetical protein